MLPSQLELSDNMVCSDNLGMEQILMISAITNQTSCFDGIQGRCGQEHEAAQRLPGGYF